MGFDRLTTLCYSMLLYTTLYYSILLYTTLYYSIRQIFFKIYPTHFVFSFRVFIDGEVLT